MNNTNINISLDTRRALKDGSYPLIMRLGHGARTTSINLNLSLCPKDWDDINKEVKKSYKGVGNVSRLNNEIQKKKTDALDIILDLQRSGELQTLSITSLKDKIVSQNAPMSFFEFGNQLVDNLVKANEIGNARCYKGTISVLKTFSNGKDLAFKDITYPFLCRFETNHKSKGNGTNGLSTYMRTIRAIYNKAIKAGLADKELYPFADYKIKSVPTEKRAIELEYLRKIIEFEVTPGSKYFNARNWFIASYMMYGMNFTDMAFLQKNDIKGGRIYYRRKKTSKLYDIKITENLERILTHYINQNPDSNYVFPIIHSETASLQAKNIQWARKRYNKKLKGLADLCGIESKLTSYVSRHSFATQAMLQQIPLNAISTMLGHSSLKTTEIYLKSLPSNILDDYNSMLVNSL